MSGRCADCLHWERRDLLVACKGWGVCAKAATRDDRPANPPTRMVARDGCVGAAWLETAPTFGCVMWEEKV